MFAPDEIDKRNFTEILFEDRNKKYGAYILRRYYYRHVFIGLGAAIFIMVSGLLFPYIIDLLKPAVLILDNNKIVEVTVLPPPPSALELEYVKPVVIPPEEEIVPVVTKDTVIQKKPKPRVQDPNPNVNAADTGNATASGGGVPGGIGSEDELFWVVDERPVPPGGSWNDYVSKNLKYPSQEKLMNVQGKVYITCIINKDGSLQDIKVVQGVSEGLNIEALRIVKSMPKWQPAKRNGMPVRMIVKLPINFSLKR